MSEDRPDGQPDPREEQVRRTLADARHTDPMPDDVVARLDGVLADLRAEGGPVSADPAVASRAPADLAAARRRRHARTWLVAAAAVVAVGLGLNQLVDREGGSSGSADAGASSRTDDRAGSDAGGKGATEAKPSTGPEADSQLAGPVNDDQKAPVRLRSGRFGSEVARLQQEATTAARRGESGGARPAELRGFATPCPTTGWGEGRVVEVRYDGAPGGLVFRVPQGDTQVVELFLCGSDDATRSITLPRR